jgi:antitoxin CptB
MDDPELSRLRWRSRRGMRELDQLLTRWLDQVYPTADAQHRCVFEKLLACEDDQLWRWFIGRETPETVDIDELVGRILALSP